MTMLTAERSDTAEWVDIDRLTEVGAEDIAVFLGAVDLDIVAGPKPTESSCYGATQPCNQTCC